MPALGNSVKWKNRQVGPEQQVTILTPKSSNTQPFLLVPWEMQHESIEAGCHECCANFKRQVIGQEHCDTLTARNPGACARADCHVMGFHSWCLVLGIHQRVPKRFSVDLVRLKSGCNLDINSVGLNPVFLDLCDDAAAQCESSPMRGPAVSDPLT